MNFDPHSRNRFISYVYVRNTCTYLHIVTMWYMDRPYYIPFHSNKFNFIIKSRYETFLSIPIHCV